MKIAQIAPVIERIPPKKYGGTERVVHTLTEELVKRGHAVTLFGSGDSETSATLHAVYPRALREARLRDIYGLNAWTMFNIGAAYDRQEEYDIIHDHNGHISLPTANAARTPVVMTMHGPFTPENRHIYRALNKPYLVTISNSQAIVPGLNYAGTVYNGIDFAGYPYSGENDGYLLFVGRISMEKGVHNAIEVAINTGLPLIIAAKLDDVDRNYFRVYVEPFLSDKIQWVGEVDSVERNRLMSRAMCFLHPITWREPFGLTIIEAMACGCPVVAFGRGSVPELVISGRTGFVVETIEEMIDAVVAIETLDRAECRRHALENFNASRMADGYEAVYAKVLESRNAHALRRGVRENLSGFVG